VPRTLHERLADFSGWTPEGIIAGNGSNELIQACLMVTVGRKTAVLINEPTFALYRQVATVLEGNVIAVRLNSNLAYDVDALLEAIVTHEPQVTIICSPNNPTGCLLRDDDLRWLLKTTSGLVIVDEAYHEFAEHSVVPLLREHENLIVLRTFSKAMALAALRTGYLLAAPALVREIGKAVLPYNLNAVSQIAAEVALEMYQNEVRPLVREIITERARLYEALAQLNGLTPFPSRANFILVKSVIDPKRVFAELIDHGILIRDVSSYALLEDCFRVSVGTPAENDALLETLQEIMR